MPVRSQYQERFVATITKVCDDNIKGVFVKFNGEIEGFVSLSKLRPKNKKSFHKMLVGNSINIMIMCTNGIYNYKDLAEV